MNPPELPVLNPPDEKPPGLKEPVNVPPVRCDEPDDLKLCGFIFIPPLERNTREAPPPPEPPPAIAVNMINTVTTTETIIIRAITITVKPMIIVAIKDMRLQNENVLVSIDCSASVG